MQSLLPRDVYFNAAEPASNINSKGHEPSAGSESARVHVFGTGQREAR